MSRRLAVLGIAVLAACGPSGGGGKVGDKVITCAMAADRGRDCDGDGFTPDTGDCRDDDVSAYPGAPELCDHKDHNCDGIPDESCDDDKDGYAIKGDGMMLRGGDCNDADPLVNPGAYEFVGNMIDDDCNDKVDEATAPCPEIPGNDGLSFAASMDVCAPWVTKAEINHESDPAARSIRATFGKYKPRGPGASMVVLSTGIAGDKSAMNFIQQQPGTAFHNDDPNPLPQPSKSVCYQGPDELNVHDLVKLTLTLKVPTNAKSFSFNFNFMTAEYPEYVGSQYNDKFLVIVDSKSFKGNVSFDKTMQPITVNVAFFEVCDTADICNGQKQNMCMKPANELDGTGFEIDAPKPWDGNRIGGGTGWLTTTAPVTPGETITLRFILFDEGDRIYDSVAVLDNFKWSLNAAMAPVTMGRDGGM